MRLRSLTLALSVLGAFPAAADESPDVHRFDGAGGAYVAERVLEGLSQPVAIEFLPDGRALVAQRNLGAMTRVDFAAGTREDVSGMPPMLLWNDTGIHDIELHPQYPQNGWIYISYTVGQEFHSTLALDRVRLDGSRVVATERLFTADAFTEKSYHFGGKIQFLEGYLYLTVGDRQHPELARDPGNHAGTVVRLHDDGRVPADNPFATPGEGAGDPPRPEIWSYGHRNPQGLVADAAAGVLWAHEHGPRGGDELNRIERGADYGWPEISFGFEYDGGPIGKGIVTAEGMQQPVWVWVPSIAPSDMVLYRGDAFPAWRGNLLLGSLALAHLNRVVIEDGAVVLEERLARGVLGRIRAVAVDAGGRVYLGNDAGEIWRLRPE